MENETVPSYQSRRGSVSVLLSLAGLGIIVIGIIVGNSLVRQGPRQLPRAQTAATPTPTGMCGKACTSQVTCGPVKGPCAGGVCTLDDLDYAWENSATVLRIKNGTNMWRYVRNTATASWDFASTANFAAAPYNRTDGVDEMDFNMEPVNNVMTNIIRLRKGTMLYGYYTVNGTMQLVNTTNLATSAPFNASGGICSGTTCHIHEFDASTERGGKRILRFREGNIIWGYEYVNGAWVYRNTTNLAYSVPFNATDGVCPGGVCSINNFDFDEENGVLYARFRTNNVIRTYRYTSGATPEWALTNTSASMTTLAQLNDPGSGLFCDGGKCKIGECVGKTCTCTAPPTFCVPTLIAPANNATVQILSTPGSVSMQWSCAGSTRFQVNATEVGTGGGYSSLTTGTTYSDPNGYYANHPYDWKVRSCGDTSCTTGGAWSQTFRFSVVVITPSPTPSTFLTLTPTPTGNADNCKYDGADGANIGNVYEATQQSCNTRWDAFGASRPGSKVYYNNVLIRIYGPPTPTVTPACTCTSSGDCESACVLDKHPAVNGFTYANPFRCARAGTTGAAGQLNQWCSWSKRPRGDADGDGVVNLVDYNYYRRAVFGVSIAATANPDFNGDGQVGEFDIPIIKKTLQDNGLPIP